MARYHFMREIYRSRGSRSTTVIDEFASQVADLFDDEEAVLSSRVASIAHASRAPHLEEARRRAAFSFYIRAIATELGREDVEDAAACIANGEWDRASSLLEVANERAHHDHIDDLLFFLSSLSLFQNQVWCWSTAPLRANRDRALAVLDDLAQMQ